MVHIKRALFFQGLFEKLRSLHAFLHIFRVSMAGGNFHFWRKRGRLVVIITVHPKAILTYKTAVLKVKGLDMNLVISTHTGVGDVHMCVSLNSSRQAPQPATVPA